MATPTEDARESDHMPAFPAGDDEQIMAPQLREDAEVVALTALASRYAPFDPLVALRLFRAELCAGDRVELPFLLESLAAVAPRLVDAGDPVLRTLCDGSAVAAFLRRRAPADADGAQRVDYALWQQLVWRCVDEALPELRRRALLHGQCYWGLGRNVRTGVEINHQTSELSISVKSKSIRLIFGRIDYSRRVFEARRKTLAQTVRLRAH